MLPKARDNVAPGLLGKWKMGGKSAESASAAGNPSNGRKESTGINDGQELLRDRSPVLRGDIDTHQID